MRCMTDPVAHAKSYPFPVPGTSYRFVNGAPEALDDHGFDRAGRVPVLAAGSNQSHEQLARKYSVLDGHVEIPVQRAALHDFDAVYAAHLAGYGSVPSTFCPSPGTAVTTYVLWLDDAQLNRMHETERNYTYDVVEDIRVEIDDTGEVVSTAHIYTARVGCVNVDGAAVALSEISARGRTLRAMSQVEMLGHVRDRLDPGVDLDAFIRAHIEDERLRHARAAALATDSLPLTFRRREIDAF
jgi:hypothetical protein